MQETAPATPARQATSPQVKQKRPVWPVILGIILLIAAGVLAWWLFNAKPGGLVAVDEDKYQAVFLSNGQVYFGKLSNASAEYLQLTDVYYLERQMTAEVPEEPEGQPASDDNNFQLLKYSDVLYGSEDLMVISKSDVLRYENLRPDGVVARAIADRN